MARNQPYKLSMLCQITFCEGLLLQYYYFVNSLKAFIFQRLFYLLGMYFTCMAPTYRNQKVIIVIPLRWKKTIVHYLNALTIVDDERDANICKNLSWVLPSCHTLTMLRQFSTCFFQLKKVK